MKTSGGKQRKGLSAESSDGGPAPVDIPESIVAALAQLKDDPGALFAPPVLAEIKAIHRKKPQVYARIRACVRAASRGVISELDRLMKVRERPSVESLEQFKDAVPWPEPVMLGDVLDEVFRTLKSIVVASDHTLVAAALWTAHTWVIEHLDTSPIANITAPEKRCGKTVLLTAIGRFAYKPLSTSNAAPAALFRAIDRWRPTLLIDEADSFLAARDELRGILNAGVTRDGAYVLRCVGDDHEPRRFSTWGAKAICGIGNLPATLADRSIRLELKRKLPSESRRRLGEVPHDTWAIVCRKFARWSKDSGPRLRRLGFRALPGLNDRANDMWDPMLRIAELASPEWLAKAEQAALATQPVEEALHSTGTQLLEDLRALVGPESNLSSTHLLSQLVKRPDLRWKDYSNGRPLNPNQFGRLMAGFGLSTSNQRHGDKVLKTYAWQHLKEAFDRYLPAPLDQAATPLQD